MRPAALARAEMSDVNAHWMPPHARRRTVGEAERLLEQNPGAADEVSSATKTAGEAREKMTKWKGIPRPKSTTMDLVIGIGKELMALFEE